MLRTAHFIHRVSTTWNPLKIKAKGVSAVAIKSTIKASNAHAIHSYTYWSTRLDIYFGKVGKWNFSNAQASDWTSLKSLRLRDLLTFGYLWLPLVTLLGLTLPYWALLDHTRPYWALLDHTTPYWASLCLTWPYLDLLGLTGLGLTGPYWALLGLT